MTIPKIIHYCWFGGNEKSDLIKKCIKSWEKLKDYKIIEWNEKNFDVNSHPYVKKAYESKRYAFVSDYVRLKALYEMGGIYLDTDVEIKKELDEFLIHKMFIGFMYDSLLGTALLGAEKNHIVIKDLLHNYDYLELKNVANNDMFTGYFLNKFENFKLNNRFQILDYGVAVYPKEYFERPTYNRRMGYAVHHYTASWKKSDKYKVVKECLRFIIGDVLYKKLTHRNALRKTAYYDIYLKHIK